MATMSKTNEIKYDVIQEIAVLSENEKGTSKKELNLVSWNDGEAKYDIRDWMYDENGERNRCRKGITLSMEEFENLKEALLEADDEDDEDEEDYDEDDEYEEEDEEDDDYDEEEDDEDYDDEEEDEDDDE